MDRIGLTTVSGDERRWEERWPVSVFKYGIDDASGANAAGLPLKNREPLLLRGWGGKEGEREERRSEKRHEIYRGWWPIDGGTNSALSKSITTYLPAGIDNYETNWTSPWPPPSPDDYRSVPNGKPLENDSSLHCVRAFLTRPHWKKT